MHARSAPRRGGGKHAPKIRSRHLNKTHDASPCERAQRIRDLVGTARVCIIEVGRELIAAKAEVGHGGWLDWIEGEFGWSERTAENYMLVARKFASVADFSGLTIDATALYALAAPSVPQRLRDEAIERAAAGELLVAVRARMTDARIGEHIGFAFPNAGQSFPASMSRLRPGRTFQRGR